MRWILMALSLALGACGGGGGGETPDADPFAPDADPFVPDANPFAPDANPLAPDAAPGTPDAGLPSFPVCLTSCGTAADCTIAGSVLYDGDNWACDTGTCRYTGCNSTSECTTALMNPAYTCGTLAPSPLPTCYKTCGAATDCVIAGSTLYDGDNWACDTGKCRWTGCNSTSECTSALMNPDYVCEALPGVGFDTCVETCASVTDCVIAGSALYDADNYACTANRCQWLGCNSTAECTSSLMDPDYVCVM